MLTSPLPVADPALTRIFADSAKRRLLLSFVEGPRSISEVARALQRPLSYVHYHVTDLLKLGLLKVEEEKRRGGRSIKYYRSVSSGFLVPIDLFENSPTQGLAAELRSSLSDELLGSNLPLHFYCEDGEPRVSMFKGKGYSGSAAELWRIVNFDDQTVRAFAAELRDLMGKYEGLSKSGRAYLIHAAYAPRRHR